MMMPSREKTKIKLYMYLWEMFHKASTLQEFENRCIFSIFQSKKIELPDRKNIVSEVISDFYSANGVKLALDYRDEQPEMSKTLITPEENLHTAFLMRTIDSNPYFLGSSEEKENLFFLSRQEAFESVSGMSDEGISLEQKFEMIKTVLRKIYGLDDRDAVFQFNDKIFIRYFSQKTSEGKQRRYNGLPESEMETLKARYEKLDFDRLLGDLTRKMLFTRLKLYEVDNFTFHQKYLRILIGGLKNLFKRNIKEDNVLDGFASFVLRQHIDTVLDVIVREIILLVESGDQNIKSFLNFYDGRDVIVQRVKQQKSEIIVDGERWSYNPIRNLASQRQLAQANLDKKDEEILALKVEYINKKEDLNHMEQEGEKLQQDYQTVKEQAQQIYDHLRTLRTQYQKLQIKLSECSDKNIRWRLEREIDELKETIQTASKTDTALLKRRNALQIDLEHHLMRIDDLQKDVLAYENNVEIEKEKRDRMAERLVPVLEQLEKVTNAIKRAILRFRIQMYPK